MRILLLGVTGQVGWELARTLSVMGELITTGRGGRGDVQLDTGDLRQLQATLDSTAPDVVVNATAYTAVDKAENEPAQAMLLNAEVPGLIGAWAARHGALVIHYSTDYVFDGSKDTPYVETDATNPVSVYGRSKLAGDRALLASGCAALILRASWVYGMRGSNFLLTMRRLMQERSALNIVDDQVGAPTWCRTIAQVTATALARMPDTNDARQALYGVYHLSPKGSTSWFGFATAIQHALGLPCDLHPIPSSEYPTPVSRPMNSRMDAAKLQKAFGLELPAWERDLALCLDAQVD
ncbi:MAG: dTDP-4-dehydrorhamnose reductase [Gammaproteobacteria bacterium]|nr:dTDP-4-dehydrorhamnose reductase [Gammaproteobacteria bacterium]